MSIGEGLVQAIIAINIVSIIVGITYVITTWKEARDEQQH